jgi:hypothetical protein
MNKKGEAEAIFFFCSTFSFFSVSLKFVRRTRFAVGPAAARRPPPPAALCRRRQRSC